MSKIIKYDFVERQSTEEVKVSLTMPSMMPNVNVVSGTVTLSAQTIVSHLLMPASTTLSYYKNRLFRKAVFVKSKSFSKTDSGWEATSTAEVWDSYLSKVLP